MDNVLRTVLCLIKSIFLKSDHIYVWLYFPSVQWKFTGRTGEGTIFSGPVLDEVFFPVIWDREVRGHLRFWVDEHLKKPWNRHDMSPSCLKSRDMRQEDISQEGMEGPEQNQFLAFVVQAAASFCLPERYEEGLQFIYRANNVRRQKKLQLRVLRVMISKNVIKSNIYTFQSS